MSVSALIVSKDLYSRIGGGEVLYRQLIHYSQSVVFSYFCDSLNHEAEVPAHVKPISIGPGNFSSIHCQEVISTALEKVRGQYFDIIDVPNYVPIGHCLVALLKKFEITYKWIVLSCHGNLSEAASFAWNRPSIDQMNVLKKKEQSLLDLAHHLYGFSNSYLAQFKPKPTTYIRPHPVHLPHIAAVHKSLYSNQDLASKLAFIGRLDRLKGISVFLELLCFLNPKLVEEVIIFTSVDENYADGHAHIQSVSTNIRKKIKIVTGQNQVEIFSSLKKSKSLVVVPSLFDTFNLVALESIVAGIPILLSQETGISKQIKEELGAHCVPTFNVKDLASAAKILENMIVNYDFFQEKSQTLAVDFLEKIEPQGYDEILKAIGA